MCAVAIMAVLCLPSPLEAPPARDRFGGITSVRGRKTGYFHTQKIGGRWWIVTPDGNGFLSKGVCHVSYTADHAPTLGYSPYGRVTAEKYGSADVWARATVERLQAWGLNTVGAWSDPALYGKGIVTAPVLNLAASVQRDAWLTGGYPDVFSPEFVSGVREAARRQCTPLVKDPWVLGYFTDNELRWGPDWRSKESLLETFLKFPAGSPGRLRAEAVAKGKSTLADEDKARFQGEVAEQYFRTCREAIRAVDKNHMVLGCRFAGYAPEAVLKALAKHIDIVSYNDYSLVAPVSIFERLTRLTGLPFMVTEFSFKAADSGLPNTRGAALPVKTQQERADGFARYVGALAAMRAFVGYHWFEWCDEPKEGRFDGENSNYGLVRIDDTPWELLTARFTEVNATIEDVHARGK